MKKEIEMLLSQVKRGDVSLDDAVIQLQPFLDIGFAKLDINREKRTGFPEVIYGSGKTSEQLKLIMEALIQNHMKRVLITKVSEEKAKVLTSRFPEAQYNPTSQTIFWKSTDEPRFLYDGFVAVLCGGTSDIPIAEETVTTLEAFGCKAELFNDVGVAGIHRLFASLENIRNASASVVVAGMEGALPSVVAGLVDHPLFAVPTSVGYGANFQGLSALLSMLNACAPGISVVNIDNGFGAGYNAAMIHQMKYDKRR